MNQILVAEQALPIPSEADVVESMQRARDARSVLHTTQDDMRIGAVNLAKILTEQIVEYEPDWRKRTFVIKGANGQERTYRVQQVGWRQSKLSRRQTTNVLAYCPERLGTIDKFFWNPKQPHAAWDINVARPIKIKGIGGQTARLQPDGGYCYTMNWNGKHLADADVLSQFGAHDAQAILNLIVTDVEQRAQNQQRTIQIADKFLA